MRQSRTVITVTVSLGVLTQISVIWRSLKSRTEKLFPLFKDRRKYVWTGGGSLKKPKPGTERESAKTASVDELERLNN